MKNALETFRTTRGLTYRELTEACGGRSLNAVYRHCKGDKIAAESAVVYSRNLGIPLSELRPDLWPPEETTSSSPAPAKEKGGGNCVASCCQTA